jgi:hypothetical protein
MSESLWRWLAVGLITANLAVAVLFLFSRGPVEESQTTLPALDPALPLLELVTEISNNGGIGADFICYTIGPLSTLLSQQRAEDRLRPFAAAMRTRQTTADSDRGWWVYLPSNSRPEAMGLTRELAERGVEDFYVVTSGELENTVSVGLFENIDNARSRQARLRSLGFNAQMEVRREIVPQFWVDYRIAPDERSPWRFIVRASPGSQHRDIPCWDD